MFLKSSPALTGVLTISLVYKDKVVEHFKDENLIMRLPRVSLLSHLYNASATNDIITALHAGTGGTIDPEGRYPKQISRERTGLYSETVQVPTSYTHNDSLPSVTFIADIPEGAAVNTLINEAGLFMASGNMFNMKTFPGIPKTGEFGIHFEWEIDIS